MKEYSTYTKSPVLLESHHQIIECHIQDTRLASFTLLQGSSRCILLFHPTASRCGRLIPLQRCSRCILQLQPTCPSLARSYPSAERRLIYSIVPAGCVLVWQGLTPLQRCSMCILHPCARDAVDVFFSSNPPQSAAQTNVSGYLTHVELLKSRDIHASQKLLSNETENSYLKFCLLYVENILYL